MWDVSGCTIHSRTGTDGIDLLLLKIGELEIRNGHGNEAMKHFRVILGRKDMSDA